MTLIALPLPMHTVQLGIIACMCRYKTRKVQHVLSFFLDIWDPRSQCESGVQAAWLCTITLMRRGLLRIPLQQITRYV